MNKKGDEQIRRESSVPDIKEMAASFKTNRVRLDPYIQRCKANMDIRFCRWTGQSQDQRKHGGDLGQDALPWEGASDIRYFLIDAYSKALVSGAKAAVKRMKASANPSNAGDFDVKKAANAALMVKYLIQQVPGLLKQVEINCNNMLNTGICVSYVYWKHEEQKMRRTIEIGELSPEEQQVVLTPEAEDIAVKVAKMYLTHQDADDDEDAVLMSDDEIRSMIQELRETGKSKITYQATVSDKGAFIALSPYERILWPAYTIEPQDAEYVDMVMYYNEVELRNKVHEEEWDSAWVERVIETCKGRDSMFLLNAGVRMDGQIPIHDKIRDVVQVIHRFSKQTSDDGCPVIYETIFHPFLTMEVGEATYAKHWIREDALGEYPFVVTKWEEYSERLYETRSLVEMLSGTQFTLKAFMDASVDRESLTKLPPQLRRQTGLDAEGGYAGPMTSILVRDMDEVRWMEPPPYDVNSDKIREEVRMHADLIAGIPNQLVNPVVTQVRVQDFYDKVSEHLDQIALMLFKLSKVCGPDEMWFRVGGSQEKVMYKHDIGDEYAFGISLDASNNDWEMIKAKLEAFGQLKQWDMTGLIQSDRLIRAGANFIDPLVADEIIGSPQESQQRSISEEDQAISKVASGIPLDLTEDEQRNMLKAQRFMSWFQTPAGQMAAQSQVVGPMVQNRAKQWQFAMQQNQNAQIGRLGAMPTNNGANGQN